MSLHRRTLAIFAGAAALRLAVFVLVPWISEFLIEQVEISTPISSFKRLQEGLFLYQRGVSPYDGGVFHQAPILLVIFELVPVPVPGVLFTLLDLWNAYALIQLADSGQAQSTRLFKSPRAADRLSSDTIAAAYLFNPFTIIACLGQSTTAFTNAAIFQAVANAALGQGVQTVLALSFATYLSIYPILLLPPIMLLQFDQSIERLTEHGGVRGYVIKSITSMSIVLGLLQCSTPIIMGSFWDVVTATYGAQLFIVDLTPNMGLWWYFFIEIFDPFREFFIGVFWLHLAGYVGGLCIRLRRQPLFVITAMLGLLAIFKPYPSVSDVSLYLAFVPLYKHVLPLMRYTFIASSVLLYSTLLGPAFYYLWIYSGAGNANFFYAITLVWSLGLTMILGDSLFAVLRDEWEVERPEMKGKDVRQI